ncbi:hypothetical protein SLEP1_g27523 [Rubroshorea leprosula]|uniref:Uncharacterized protein n=1 Tax=Rubroshorea leprosula TaxID=152421 RepID=A0AAV5K1H1_9ROSI|nr:hypothetical protein SLEP1_g27523 [Rubroshorea leprosula]
MICEFGLKRSKGWSLQIAKSATHLQSAPVMMMISFGFQCLTSIASDADLITSLVQRDNEQWHAVGGM